jgi:protein-tyrosine phosphatase
MSSSHRILFICMGNLCRSPLAEAVFVHKAESRGVIDRFSVDSAGTGGWHAGEPADPRMRAAAARFGVTIAGTARQVTAGDLRDFDLLVCMDENNRDDLLRRGAPEEKLHLLLEFDGALGIAEVPDPYYGGLEGFETVYRLVDSACDAMLDHLCDEAAVDERERSG